MVDFPLWELLGNLSSFITIVSEMQVLLNNTSEKCAMQKLKRLNPSVDFSALPDDLAYCADNIEIYIAKHEVLGDKLFPEEDKNEFVRKFFEEYPDLLPYKKYAGDWLRAYLNYAETLILQHADPMQKLLHREIESVEKLVENISKEINEKNEGQAQQPYTANELYTKSFTKPLFLHKNDEQVTLENLFVLQKYIGLDTYFAPTHQINLCDRLVKFVNEEASFVMFIEGDAGSGKSSLISWMNYHVNRHDSISQQLMEDKALITIRLRDLNKTEISAHESLIPAILNYMHIETIDDLEAIFPKAVLVLDGFDELCMIENITDYEGLIYDLYRRRPANYKIIVTTRPKYIRTERINIPHKSISLQHFDSELRAEWLDRYTSPQFCNQPLPSAVRSFIENIDDDDTSIICDTPMTLYMLAAKKLR